jgi:hypothetical protein
MNSTESAKLAPSSEGVNAGHTLIIYVKNARRGERLAFV